MIRFYYKILVKISRGKGVKERREKGRKGKGENKVKKITICISEGNEFERFLFQILSFFSIFQYYTNFLIFF